MNIETIKWIDPTPDFKQPILRLIDQTKLPSELKFIDCVDVEMVAESIEVLRVRNPGQVVLQIQNLCVLSQRCVHR